MPKQKAPKTRKQRIEFLKKLYESMNESYTENHYSWDDIYMGWNAVASLKIGAMAVYKVIQIMGYDIKFTYLDGSGSDDGDDTISAAVSLGGDLHNIFHKVCEMVGIEYDATEPEYFGDDVNEIIFDGVPAEVLAKINDYHKVLVNVGIEYFTIIYLKYPGFFSKLKKLEKEYEDYITELIAYPLFMSPFYVNYYGNDRDNFIVHGDDLYLCYSTGSLGDTGEDLSDAHVNPARIILLFLIYEMFKGVE